MTGRSAVFTVEPAMIAATPTAATAATPALASNVSRLAMTLLRMRDGAS
jgi:hypothetical protein